MTDARPWTYAALFGALWGAMEATVGTAVHLGKLPMRGAAMGVLGLLCLICLRRLQNRPGVCLLAGLVVAAAALAAAEAEAAENEDHQAGEAEAIVDEQAPGREANTHRRSLGSSRLWATSASRLKSRCQRYPWVNM